MWKATSVVRASPWQAAQGTERWEEASQRSAVARISWQRPQASAPPAS